MMRYGSLLMMLVWLGVATAVAQVPDTSKKNRSSISLQPAFLDFGEVLLVESKQHTVTIISDGKDEAEIERLRLNGDGDFALLEDRCSGRELDPGQRCELLIAFTPAVTGHRRAELLIIDDDDELLGRLAISGQGIAPMPLQPVMVVASPLDFGELAVGLHTEQPLLIRNEGSAPLVIGQIGLAVPLQVPFSLTGDLCSGRTVPPGGNCSLHLTFAPTAAGSYGQEFDIPSNDPQRNPVLVRLQGVAVVPPEAHLAVIDSLPPVDDLRLPFGTVSIGHTVEQTVTLRNTGNAALRLGPIAAAQFLRQPFAVAADLCSNRTLQPQEVCTLPISFAPTTAGSFDSTFDIPSDAGEPVIFRVSGSGTEVSLPRITVTDSLPPLDDRQLDFAEVTVGRTVEATVTVTNTGTDELRIAQIFAVPAPFALSADQCSGANLQVGDSCLLLVTFAPTFSTDFQGELTIPSNDAEQPIVRLTLAGRGVAAGVNQPPSPPRLLSPGDGQRDMGLLVTLRWQQSVDPDGDPLRYRVRWSTDANLTDAQEWVLEPGLVGMLSGEMLLAIGLCGVGALRRPGRVWPLLLLTLLLTTLSCSSGTEESAQVASWQLRELQQDTTYYWQIVAEDDRGEAAASQPRSFSTGRR